MRPPWLPPWSGPWRRESRPLSTVSGAQSGAPAATPSVPARIGCWRPTTGSREAAGAGLARQDAVSGPAPLVLGLGWDTPGDLDRFTPDREGARTRLGLGGQTRIVFAARRLVPRMGLDVLLDAWSRLPSQ